MSTYSKSNIFFLNLGGIAGKPTANWDVTGSGATDGTIDDPVLIIGTPGVLHEKVGTWDNADEL